MSKPDVTSPEWVDWALEQLRGSAPRRRTRRTRPRPGRRWHSASIAEEPDAGEVRRRRPVAGLVAAAVALVAALAVGWWWLGQPDADPDDQARTVAAGSTTGPPPSPVRLSAGGAHTVVRVLPSGDLAVRQ